MLLPWMQKLIDSVPADFSPELSPAGDGETVKGNLPDDIAPWFKASVWARLESIRVSTEHEREHEKLELDNRDLDVEKNIADSCLEARVKVEQLENRGAVLGLAAREALIEHFGLKADADIEVRQEGVVLIEPVTTNDVSGLGLLMAALAGADSSSGPRGRY